MATRIMLGVPSSAPGPSVHTRHLAGADVRAVALDAAGKTLAAAGDKVHVFDAATTGWPLAEPCRLGHVPSTPGTGYDPSLRHPDGPTGLTRHACGWGSGTGGKWGRRSSRTAGS